MWNVYGHDAVKFFLEKQLKFKLLNHAYLFVGPAGVGKKQLALDFARQILNTRQLARHPDFQILESEGEIIIQSVLEMIERLRLKPFAGDKKVAIIDNAENLNLQSSNALLKTLEEPPFGTVVILIANSRRLLPTILSRCQIFNFNGFSKKQLGAFARQQGFSADDDLLALSFGSIGRLQALRKDPLARENQDKIIADFKKIKSRPIAERLLAVADYARLEEAELKSTILFWCLWQFSQLDSEPENFRALGTLSWAWSAFEKNRNKKLILQNLFLNI